MKAKTRIASFVAVVGSDSLEDFGLVPFLAQIKSFTRGSQNAQYIVNELA